MAKISRSVIEQIKSRADIVEVVSDVVQLKRRGKNYFALCPFHEEKTPSFSVNPDMGIFYCFGCGKGGNVITFVMEYEKVDFLDAIRMLADKYGVQIEWDEEGSRAGEVALLYELHDVAADFYHKNLLSQEGASALKYLNERGYDRSIIDSFHLGYALDEWDALFNRLDLNRYSPEIIEKSGLFIKGDRNRFYDRFRNRIMFPITSVSGRVVAFGGRSLDPQEGAKYINSPETPIYFKSGVLYGLSASKDFIRKDGRVIVVEGYTDFLRLFSSGITNVVAVSGTALNYHHARVLKRFTSEAVLCYDGDEAGLKATWRAGFVLLKEGFDVRVALLPEGEDPDSFIKSSGRDPFEKEIENSQNFIPFYLNSQKGSLSSLASRTDLLQSVIEEIAQIRNPITREFVVKDVAEQLKIEEGLIHNQIRAYYRRGFVPEGRATLNTDREANRIKLLNANEKAEYEILKLLLSQQEKIQKIIIENLPERYFSSPVMRGIYEKLREMIPTIKQFSLSDIFDHDWTEIERSYLSRLIFEAESLQFLTEIDTLFNLSVDYITLLLTSPLKEKAKDLRERIGEIEKRGEDPSDLIFQLEEVRKHKEEEEKRIRSIKIQRGEI